MGVGVLGGTLPYVLSDVQLFSCAVFHACGCQMHPKQLRWSVWEACVCHVVVGLLSAPKYTFHQSSCWQTVTH